MLVDCSLSLSLSLSLSCKAEAIREQLLSREGGGDPGGDPGGMAAMMAEPAAATGPLGGGGDGRGSLEEEIARLREELASEKTRASELEVSLSQLM